MTTTDTENKPREMVTEEFDVLIVGAGVAGVGGAYHLSTQRPDSSFVVLESQESFGGTWWSWRPSLSFFPQHYL